MWITLRVPHILTRQTNNKLLFLSTLFFINRKLFSGRVNTLVNVFFGRRYLQNHPLIVHIISCAQKSPWFFGQGQFIIDSV
jgi:hypothetical protein